MSNVFHIEIDEGSDYSTTFLYEDSETGLPVDLTDYSARMQVRRGYDGYTRPDSDLTLSSATAEDGYGVILGGAEGTIQIVIRGQNTRNLQWDKAVYDLVLVSPTGKRKKFLEGFVTVIPSATKSYPGDPDDYGNEFTLSQYSTPVVISGNSIQTTLATILLPANSVKPNGRLKITTFFQCTNSQSQKIFRVKIDDIEVNKIIVTQVNGSEFDTNLFADGSGETSVWFGSSDSTRVIGDWADAAFDLTQDHTITVTGELIDPTEYISLNAYSVRAINPL